jgi:hypothetical protein
VIERCQEWAEGRDRNDLEVVVIGVARMVDCGVAWH